jgi:signal transduction histidine kinase/ligand-binding sensor domain-containing protein/CheY-like chemotaxis protein
MKTRLFLVFLFTQVFVQLAGQDHFFRQYGPSDGLGNSFIYSINQGKDGYLWIGTAEGLYRFNGFEFQHYTEKDSLAENFVTTIYNDFSGGLWLGHINGGITHIADNRFNKLINTTAGSASITSITEADTGTIWFSTQNGGLIVSRPGKKITRVSTPLSNELIFKIRYISGNFFLVGTQENLYILEYNQDSSSMTEKAKIKDYPLSKVAEILKINQGEYFIFSKDKGIYRLSVNPANLSYDLTEISFDSKGDLDNIQGARIVLLNELWVNTVGKGIIKYQIDKGSERLSLSGYINTDNGLKSNEVNCIFEDREDNIWLGMYGGGLLKLIDDNIKFLSYSERIGSNHIYALSKDSNNIWLASDNLLAKVTPERGQVIKSYPFPQSLSGARVNSVYCSPGGLIYLGFDREGLFAFNPVNENFTKIFLSGDALENSINHITGKGSVIWISTKKGACKLSTVTGIRKWFNKSNGLPNNNIQQLYIDSNGRVLVGTTCNTVFYIGPDDNITTLSKNSSFGLNSVMSFAEDNNGSLWIATYGNGVYRFRADGNMNYAFSSGLVSDYCYNLIFDKSHKIMVGHKGGFSQIDTETGKIRNYISNEGIKSTSDFYPNAVLTDFQNNIWFGTSEGLVKLLSLLNTIRKKPPILHIDAIYVNKVKISFNNVITLRPGNYEIKVEFTGINLSNPEIVNYQTIMEGYSSGWSDLSPRRMIVYEKVGRGQYVFKLRAYNEDDVSAPEPLTFKLIIRKPVYQSFWFYLAIISAIGFSLYLYIRTREKNMKTLQERLLKNLDEKTKEIIVKEEIIKERKKAEKELIAARDRAELSDKLKSSFLTNMSHEIRTPMNAIVGLSELLKDKYYSEEEKVEFLDLIVSNSISLLGLIDDILDLSKIESNQLNIHFKACAVYPLLDELYQRYAAELKSREKSDIDFRLSVETRGNDLTFDADGSRLKQVLGKLLDNAIKYTDSGYIVLGCYTEEDRIFFYVEDTGIGLSEDKKEVIFKLFRKVEDNTLRLYRGTGLGLSLSQNLVKLMGGEIKVESEVNKGSRFYFSLPFKKSTVTIEQVPVIGHQDHLEPNWSGKIILVVEDDASGFMFLYEILKSSGADILRAENGIDAIKMLSSEKKPDIIIMDMKLPGIDGYEATRRIREINKVIPIIANTAYAMAGDREKSIEAGCNDYISKPTDRKQLLDLIKKYLR